MHTIQRPQPNITHPKNQLHNENSAVTQNIDNVHSLTGVNDVHKKLNIYGYGVKVAVIDTGIYYLHPALGGCFGDGCKVAGGYDFVGDAYSSSHPYPVADTDPLDNCSDDSHGTHVAGIIIANTSHINNASFQLPFIMTGVAPQATLYAYRVFGCSADSSSNDIIAAAIYKAADDGVDVINLSLGGGPGFGEDILEIAAMRVNDAGHILLQANGNDGSSGAFTSESSSSNTFDIASFDSPVTVEYESLSVDNQIHTIRFGLYNSAYGINEVLKIYVNNINAIDNNIQNDGCTLSTIPIRATTTGITLLLRFGTACGSKVRCDNAYSAGYSRCLLYWNDVNIGSIYGSSYIPSAATTDAAGLAIVTDVKNQIVPVVQIVDKLSVLSQPTAGTVSWFSSIGLNEELYVKPDIGAIGGDVYSTISKNAQAGASLPVPYASYSGICIYIYISCVVKYICYMYHIQVHPWRLLML